MGFGHAIAVTPIQLLTIVAGITNGGIRNTPTVVKEIVSSSSEALYKPQTNKKRIVSEQTSKIINQMLQKAENKLADYSFVEGYNVGGKTGTAQKYDETGKIANGKYISSFIGTYPADNPQYLFMIMVDEPSAGAYYGSLVAAPYGKMFFSKMFEFYNIPKDDQSVKIEETIMPQVTGMSLANAVAQIKKAELEYEIDGCGGVIKNQLPPAGTILQKGSTVLLVTN